MRLRLTTVIALALAACGVENAPSDSDAPPTDPLAAYGCPGDGAPASVTGDAYAVLCRSCLAYCHVGNPAAGGMNLEPRNVTETVIAVRAKQAPKLYRISPGYPDESYLVRKIRGTHLEAGGEGQRMPAGGLELSAARRAKIERWIAEMPAGATRPVD